MAIINDITRSIIYHSKPPESFWDYATEYATQLYNRTPTKALPYQAIIVIIPYTAWAGKAPKLSKARIFGCAAYPFVPSENRRKLDPRIKPSHILVSIKGESLWRVLSIHTLKESISADVAFNEYLFPYQTSQTPSGVYIPPHTQNIADVPSQTPSGVTELSIKEVY